MAKWTKRKVKQQVYGEIAAWLRGESRCDIDDPEFIDIAVQVQNEIADQFAAKVAKLDGACG